MTTPVSPPPVSDAAATERRARRWISVLGWVATLSTVSMYLAYADQIARNLAGHPGSVIQPAVACVSCTLWACYAFFRETRDWPLLAGNLPGIVLAAAAAATAL